MFGKKKEKENHQKDFARFNEARKKLSMVSESYVQGKIKHAQYAEQIDALIEASGWSRKDFEEELNRRRNNLNKT